METVGVAILAAPQLQEVFIIAATPARIQIRGAAMYSYMSQFFTGTLGPTWPHFVLIGGSILGGALVGLGVILEAHKIFSLPTLAVVLGIVLEAAATILLFGFDEGISSKQQSTIEGQQGTIIDLQRQIKEGQDVLMWQMMPRMLGQTAECRKILRASPTGAKVRIVWQSGVSDGDGFAFLISTCFSDPERPWPPKWDIEKKEVGILPSGAEKTGVTVISNKPDDWLNSPQTPGGFITKALREGVFLHKGIGPLTVDPSLPDDEVIIAIGPKLP